MLKVPCLQSWFRAVHLTEPDAVLALMQIEGALWCRAVLALHLLEGLVYKVGAERCVSRDSDTVVAGR